jgi:predicted amidophosphoribosyltransferase
MKGPSVVCFGCGEPTSLSKPICDNCMRLSGQEPLAYCALCEIGLLRDSHGLHVNKAGGYAGKCTASKSPAAQEIK